MATFFEPPTLHAMSGELMLVSGSVFGGILIQVPAPWFTARGVSYTFPFAFHGAINGGQNTSIDIDVGDHMVGMSNSHNTQEGREDEVQRPHNSQLICEPMKKKQKLEKSDNKRLFFFFFLFSFFVF